VAGGAARDFSTLDTLSTGRWCAYGVVAAGGRLVPDDAGPASPRPWPSPVSSRRAFPPPVTARSWENQVKEGIPWATFLGFVALELAQKGFTGPTDILDHPAYYDRDRIVGGVGKRFAVEEVYFKPYACCRWIHSALDGLLLARGGASSPRG